MSDASTYVEDFLGRLKGELEPFAYSVSDLVERYGRAYQDDAAFILRKLEEFAARHGHGLPYVLDLYLRFTEHTVEEYRLYGATGRYRYETGEPGGAIFPGGDFDLSYLYVLTASTALNRSRYEVYRHYREAAREYLKPGGSFLEIGGGNCLDALFAGDFGRVEVYEVNEKSLVWQEILGLSGKVDLRVATYDFEDSGRYDFVSMLEVLEHVSDPGEYLRGAHRALKDDGRAYLTFAIRMPQFDHLYHFKSVEQCRRLLSESGFRVADDYCTISSYRPFDEAERWELADDPRYAVTYCCVAEKQQPEEADDLLREFNLSLDL
ncbi:MAG: class I SAM-dependent methyltransferase [Pyrinomonadaceae bacterium]